jgi:hypothetical protein
MKTIVKIALGLVLGAVLLVGGCAAIIGAGVEEVESQGVTDAAVKALPANAKREEVEAELGEPSTDQETDMEGRDFDSSCIYYSRKGDLAGMWQLCFDGRGRLEARNRY